MPRPLWAHIYDGAMVRETAMARDCTESRFREVLERFGGPQRVLLVTELWDRSETRAMLELFLQELFPSELPDGGELFRIKETSDSVSQCKREEIPAHASKTASITRPPGPETAPDRTIRSRLVFFLCRPESLVLRGSRLQLREILRDLRKRMTEGGAVVGVIIRSDSVAEDAVSSLLSLLRSVFPPGSQCSEVRAAALIPGHEDTRREVQRMAYEALSAAEEQRRQSPKTKSSCFSWKRWRREDAIPKEDPEEGTALTALRYPNGNCTETMTEA